ncbi:MAG: tetratricopeptide repeat protein [Myxococcota bacterium]
MRLSALALTALLALGCAAIEGHRHFEAGNRALDRGDAAAAVTAFERAATLVPEASEVQNHLGLAYTAAGRDEDALAAFERAVVLDCDNQAAAANLSAARRRASVEAAHSTTRR